MDCWLKEEKAELMIYGFGDFKRGLKRKEEEERKLYLMESRTEVLHLCFLNLLTFFYFLLILIVCVRESE